MKIITKKEIFSVFLDYTNRSRELKFTMAKLFQEISEEVPSFFELRDGKVFFFPPQKYMVPKHLNIENLIKSFREFPEFILEIFPNTGKDRLLVLEDAIIRILPPSIKQSDYSAGVSICCASEEVAERYNKILKWEKVEDTPQLSYLTKDPGGLLEVTLNSPDTSGISIEDEFPDELKYSEMKGFLESKECGLLLLHGLPGCGKTTLIKKLIADVSSSHFVMVPGDLLNNGIETGEFLEYLLETKGKRIFVIEDAERFLLKREKGTDLGTLLNLTDGILGESLETKFICTFNTPLGNVDEALLRKGRLKMRVELGPLPIEKTRKFIPDAKGPMTLAEIFHREENNGIQEMKKIGF